MSKITVYEEAKEKLIQVQTVKEVTITQVNYPGNMGLAPMISIEGGDAIVPEMIKYMNDNKEAFITAIQENAASRVALALQDAIGEAQAFIAQQ